MSKLHAQRGEDHGATYYRGAGMMHKQRDIMRKPSSLIHQSACHWEIHFIAIAR
jgi:hypothetical protein